MDVIGTHALSLQIEQLPEIQYLFLQFVYNLHILSIELHRLNFHDNLK